MAQSLPRPQFPHLLSEEIEVWAQRHAYLDALGALQPISFTDERKHFYNLNSNYEVGTGAPVCQSECPRDPEQAPQALPGCFLTSVTARSPHSGRKD